MAEVKCPVNPSGLPGLAGKTLIDFENNIRTKFTAVGETKYIRKWKVDPRMFSLLAKQMDNRFNYLWTIYHKT